MEFEVSYRLESGRYVEVASLWKHFVQGGRVPGPTRTMLIDHYLPLVYEVAKLAAPRYPHIDPDELVSPLYERLEFLIDHFDPSMGYKFKTYATNQLFAAVNDYLREIDDFSRDLRQKRKRFEQFEHEARLHKTITGDRRHIDEIILEKAVEAGYDLNYIRNMRLTYHETPKHKHGLNWLVRRDDDEEDHPTAIDSIKAIGARDGLSPVDEEYFLRILSQYPDPQARVAAFFYLFQGDTMKSVGKLRGHSESRESQVLTHVAWFFVDYIHQEMGGLPASVFKKAGIEYGDLDELYRYFKKHKGNAAKRLKNLFRLFMYQRFSDEEPKVQSSPKSGNLVNLLGQLKSINDHQPV